MRRMGGLRKYMPVTYVTCVIGALALIGFPGTSGFFSKDIVIEAIKTSDTNGSEYAYVCVLLGVFVTALYTFRLVFMTFHGRERMDEHTREHLHESPWVVTLPLVVLAIPSIAIGWLTVGPVVFGDFFGSSVTHAPDGPLAELGAEFHGPGAFLLHSLQSPVLYLALGGVFTAWYLYLRRPELPEKIASRFARLHRVLVNKYYFDWFNENVVAAAARNFGTSLWRRGDETVIDGWLVNGSARAVGALAAVVRHVQSGYLYHYAFAMIIGLAVLLGWLLLRA
jgi:NADH-quinone oxidoreductase subunit L